VHVVGIRDKCARVLIGKLEGRRSLRRPRHRWEGLRWMLRNVMGKHRVESSGTRHRQVAACSEQGGKPSGSIKSGEFMTG